MYRRIHFCGNLSEEDALRFDKKINQVLTGKAECDKLFSCEVKRSRVSTLTIARSGDYWFDMTYEDSRRMISP
jgi:hypothetical protein